VCAKQQPPLYNDVRSFALLNIKKGHHKDAQYM